MPPLNKCIRDRQRRCASRLSPRLDGTTSTLRLAPTLSHLSTPAPALVACAPAQPFSRPRRPPPLDPQRRTEVLELTLPTSLSSSTIGPPIVSSIGSGGASPRASHLVTTTPPLPSISYHLSPLTPAHSPLSASLSAAPSIFLSALHSPVVLPALHSPLLAPRSHSPLTHAHPRCPQVGLGNLLRFPYMAGRCMFTVSNQC